MSNERIQRQTGGVSARTIILPIILTLIVLHALIIAVILMINRSSSSLSAIMQNAGTYTQDATSLLAGSSLLSETATNYVLVPLSETGEVNVLPLRAFAEELSQPRRGQDVLARFEGYDVDGDALALVQEAARSAEAMLESQLHAIALMREVYPLPEVQPLTAIPKAALTEEELALSDAGKEAAARMLVLGSVYQLNKESVSKNINACVGMLQGRSSQMAAAAAQRVARLRMTLWMVTVAIIAILALTFISLYTQILLPLGRFVRLIPANTTLDEARGFREVRLVASAYNDVLKRRDALDTILRSAAETDALTNLPNRYRFEQYLLESGESGYSTAVLLFDVNYLKKTNDTQGHLAGDKLIRTAAECIASCFGENCFRFGGDEFAAVVKDCTPETINQMVARFEETERAKNISVSLGFAYAEEIGNTSFRKLLDEADQRMYDQKKEMHSRE